MRGFAHRREALQEIDEALAGPRHSGKQAGAALKAIVEGADKVSSMVQSIAAAAAEQSAAVEQISKNVEQINSVTKPAKAA